jgi:hypothetical protein
MSRLNWLRTSLCALVLLTVGCDRPAIKTESKTEGAQTAKSESSPIPNTTNESVTPSTQDVQTAAAAKLILDDCFAKYKNIKRYEDAGRLRMKIPFKDKALDETELMRVAYEAPNRLAVQSIDVQVRKTFVRLAISV